MSFWKSLFGKAVDPVIQRAADEEVEDFVRGMVRNCAGMSEDKARQAISAQLATNFHPKVRRATVNFIVASALLKLPDEYGAKDPVVLRALHKAADAAFQEKRLIRIAVLQFHSARRGV
jgi:hypothetical protein